MFVKLGAKVDETLPGAVVKGGSRRCLCGAGIPERLVRLAGPSGSE